MEQRDTYGKAFLQIMNLWTKSDLVKEIVFSHKLASIATDLLEVDGVRLYHDQALYKEPRGRPYPMACGSILLAIVVRQDRYRLDSVTKAPRWRWATRVQRGQ